MSGLFKRLQAILGEIRNNAVHIANRILPPEQRAGLLANIQDWAGKNPKLAAFLATQLIFTGLPLFFFAVFALSVFVFSLIAALMFSILTAIVFTLFMVGAATVVVLPIAFFTTSAASFVFVWGLGGYYVLNRFNKGKRPTSNTNPSSSPSTKTIDDKANDPIDSRSDRPSDDIKDVIDGSRETLSLGQVNRDKTQSESGNVSPEDVGAGYSEKYVDLGEVWERANKRAGETEA